MDEEDDKIRFDSDCACRKHQIMNGNDGNWSYAAAVSKVHYALLNVLDINLEWHITELTRSSCKLYFLLQSRYGLLTLCNPD